LDSVRGKLDKKLNKTYDRKLEVKKKKISSKMRRLVEESNLLFLVKQERRHILKPFLVSERNYAKTILDVWWTRIKLFEKSCDYLWEKAKCEKCAGKCLIDLPRSCFDRNISFSKLQLNEAVGILQREHYSYDNFINSRKDWKQRWKNASFCPTIKGQVCNNMVRRLVAANLTLLDLVQQEKNLRILPACGGDGGGSVPSVRIPKKDNYFIKHWSVIPEK
jgi:hypothetical protein